MDEVVIEVKSHRKAVVLAYTDDVMTWKETEEDLEKELPKWVRALSKHELDIYFEKNKTLKVDITKNKKRKVTLEGKNLETVIEVNYLGHKITPMVKYKRRYDKGYGNLTSFRKWWRI